MESSKFDDYAGWTVDELDQRRRHAHTLGEALIKSDQRELAQVYEQIEIETMILMVVAGWQGPDQGSLSK